MELKLKVDLKIFAPAGTKVIENNEWITLAHKKRGRKDIVYVLTTLADKIGQIDLLDEKNWTQFSYYELDKICEVFKIQ